MTIAYFTRETARVSGEVEETLFVYILIYTSLRGGLPLVVGFVHGPHEFALVMLRHAGDVRATAVKR